MHAETPKPVTRGVLFVWGDVIHRGKGGEA